MAQHSIPNSGNAQLAPTLQTGMSDIVVSLLGAIPFEIIAENIDHDYVWSDSYQIADLLKAPSNRIPTTSAAYGSLMNAHSREIRRTAIAGLSWDGATYSISYPIDGFDGSQVWLEERGQRLSGHGTKATHIQSVLTDVTLARKASAQTAYNLTHDDLTGLWNAMRMAEAIEAAQLSSKLRRRPGYVLGVNIPNIEDITRMHGENGRDYLLQIIGGRLHSELLPTDNIARIGPGQFALLLLGASQSRATKQAEKIETWLEDTTIPSVYGEFNLTGHTSLLPLGVSVTSGSDMLALLTTQSTSPKPLPTASAKETDTGFTEADIHAALNENALELAYQPIVGAADRSLHHYECLLRHNKNGKLASAWQLILAAEDHGLIHLLDHRALQIGYKTLRAQPDIHLAFNVSPGTISHVDAAESYLKTLKSFGSMAKRITLELTETAAIEDLDTIATFVNRARVLGCRFAVDDFGSGHTSFQNILSLKVDMIKIDGTLVKDMTSNPHKQAFIRMMVDLAKSFNMETIAEMVSNEPDAILMERLGIDYFQGYMFGLPRPAPDADTASAASVAQG